MRTIEIEQCDGYTVYRGCLRGVQWRLIGVQTAPEEGSLRTCIINAFWLAELVQYNWNERFDVAARLGDQVAEKALVLESSMIKEDWTKAWDDARGSA